MSEPLAVEQVDIEEPLTDMWGSVLLFLPKAVAFIVILIIGWIIARFVLRVVKRGLERLGFDRAIERGGIGRALERSRYDASDIAAKLVYYAILLITLQFAFGVWGPNPVSDLIRSIVSWLPRAFIAVVIVVVAAAIANAVRDLITGALGGMSYGRVVATIAWAFILVLGAIAALNQVGIATTVTTPILVAVLATVAGILIIGVGGGLVRPMQNRWEGWLDRANEEARIIRERSQARTMGRQDAERQMADREMAGREMSEREMAERGMAGGPADTTAARPTTASGVGMQRPGGVSAGANPPRPEEQTQRFEGPR